MTRKRGSRGDILARLRARLRSRWIDFWIARSGASGWQRLAAVFTSWGAPPYRGQVPLANRSSKGFISPRARIAHAALLLGTNCFLGEFVTIFSAGGGSVSLGRKVHAYYDDLIETGPNGIIRIGDETHIQARCTLMARNGVIQIGERVGIAPACGVIIDSRDATARARIDVGDDVWIGYGALITEGASIGAGAVIAARSVVSGPIPAGAIAAGNPARVLRFRQSRNDHAPVRDATGRDGLEPPDSHHHA